MIHQNVELHNVDGVQAAEGGVRLQRVPEAVRLQLNEAAQMRVRQPDNCEIRFVCASPEARVTLSSEGECNAAVFHGVFDGRERHTIGRAPQTIRIGIPERLGMLDRAWWKGQPFDAGVRRIVLGSRRREPVILHRVEGEGIRPPAPGEIPARRYLAYGTSITHGFDSEGPHLSYVAQTAWRLGADLINLGVGGACHCEKAFADYIAGRADWDIASLELSVNMQGFPMRDFRERVTYLVNTVAGADTRRPVACITLYPYFRDFGLFATGPGYGGSPEEYRQALRDIVAACPHPNVHLIEGPELLTNIGGLTADLIHPSDNAMIEIGANLAARLAGMLRSSPSATGGERKRPS